MILKNLDEFTKEFLEKSKEKEVEIISHYNTDGIASATMVMKALKKVDRKFKINIINTLNYIIPENANQNLKLFLEVFPENSQLSEECFIISHHKLKDETKSKNILSPLNPEVRISTSMLTYHFCKKISGDESKYLKLGILGMVGNLLEKEVGMVLKDVKNSEEVIIRKGVLIFPATRPINRVLEFSISPYIEGVTGNARGVLEILRETGLTPEKGQFKSVIELDEEENQKLLAALSMKNGRIRYDENFGDIILIKMFGKFEDARELSAMINACSKQGKTDLAIKMCMEIPSAKKSAEELYVRYRQMIVSGLRALSDSDKIVGREFILINARDKIREEITGTVTTILSKSATYEEGTNLITLSYSKNKIKISARKVGTRGRSVREIIEKSLENISENFGGHENAAGAIIPLEKEKEFIENLKRNTELEIVRIN